MALGLVGKKIGMTREFFDSGISIPVTVVKVEKGRVLLGSYWVLLGVSWGLFDVFFMFT